MGQEVEEFESNFAEYIGSKHAVMVNSGSSANLLAAASLMYVRDKEKRLKAGDEIIAPAVSWSTSYFPFQQFGMKIKFVDIDQETLNYDLNALEKAISDNTKALLAVNLLGNSNSYDEIKKIINGRDIRIIEDNCESMGAIYKDKFTGTFGIVGTFSTYFSHHMSTMEGGIICTSDEELYHILLSIRSHGWTRHLPNTNLVTGRKSKDSFTESFNFVLPGFNVRPLEMSGAIGKEQLKKLPNFLSTRRCNAKRFKQLFSDHDKVMIQKEVGLSSWFGFSLVIRKESNIERKDIVRELKMKDIDTRPIVAGNFTRHSAIKFFNYEISGELKNADLIHENGLFIGNHHYSIEDQLEQIKRIVDEA